jgi:isovaleryl-CoA dehydrogenase
LNLKKYLEKEHSELRSVVKKFADDQLFSTSSERDRRENFDETIFLKMKDVGLLGVLVPESYGGLNLDILASMIVHEEIAYADPAIALSYLAHCILCTNNIVINGSEKQKQYLVPKLCDGVHIGAMGMSEADAGSDIMSMNTRVKKVDDKYRLNGSKMWITNGMINKSKLACHILYLYAKNEDTNMISSFVIENTCPGFYVGQKINNKLGMRSSSTAELVFDNCVLSEENIVSKGSSIRNMMRNLQIERLALAAIGLGISKFSLNTMIQYSRNRKTFSNFLYNYGQIQRFIANSYSEYMSCKSYLYAIAKAMKKDDFDFRIDSDSIKLVCAKLSKKVSDYAIQTLGGYGYIAEYHVERFWRDAKLLEIGGGTNEILQKNITRDLVKNENNTL